MPNKPLTETVFDLAKQLPLIDRVRLVQRLLIGIEYEIAGGKINLRKLPPQEKPPIDEDLSLTTYAIIGCAMTVHRKQGPSFREDTYQRDLEMHFADQGLDFVSQKTLEVYDSNDGDRLIGYYIPDFIVAGKVIVEIKALHGLDDSHNAQVIGYLAVSRCPVGLLINFGKRRLDWKRILPPKKLEEHRFHRQWLFVPDWLKDQLG